MTNSIQTRNCRQCRNTYRITDLERYTDEKGTKRWMCKESCEHNKLHNSLDTVNQTTTNNVMKLNLNDIAATINEVNEELEEIKAVYNGEELNITAKNKQVITTFILGEKINHDFCAALKTYLRLNKATLHIFFLKRYIKDLNLTQDTLTALHNIFEGYDINFHVNHDVIFNDDELEVKASANVHHTAVKPLSGVKSLAKTKYLIIPHSRQELDITVNSSWANKSLLMSTGCLNNLAKGHTQSLAKAKHHSITGAVVFDPQKLDGYGLLPINFDGEGFIVYTTYYAPSGAKLDKADSVYLDDLHSSMVDYDYLNKMEKVIADVNPAQVISGDVFDGQSVCYHEASNIAYFANRMTLTDEVQVTKDVMRRLVPANGKFIMLGSNHHAFFMKFFSNPSNFKAMNKADMVLSYRTLAYTIEQSSLIHGGVKFGDPMKYLFNDMFEDGLIDFRPVENFNVHLGSHGDEYGMRANLGNQSNVKAILGHVHHPCSSKGVIWVGTAATQYPGYQSGMNNSAHGLCVLHSNGKRSLLVDL